MSLFLLSGYAAHAQTTDSTAMAAAQLPVIILLYTRLLNSK
jgi:hypothetical protein